MATVEKKSFADQVAETLIEQLKQGTAPWQRPWEPGQSGGGMPMNPTTGKRYKGINAVYLMAQGKDDTRWMTYKQAAAVGAQVKKGEKGTAIQFWKFSEEQQQLNASGQPEIGPDGQPVKRSIKLERPRVFFATVFNAEQIDGLPAIDRKEHTWDSNERAEKILQASGATIKHGEHDRAYYRPASDSIHLPQRAQFPTAANYYATALHEMGHWTGHETRLDRDLSHPFGSAGYAKEELRAEIASMILGSELGTAHDPGQHAAYVESWIKALQDDPLEIFRAAADAEKIQDYVLALEQVQQQEQQTALSKALAVDISQALQHPATNLDHYTAYQGDSLADAMRAHGLATIADVVGHDPANFYSRAHDTLSPVFGLVPGDLETSNAYLERKGLAQTFADEAERITMQQTPLRQQAPAQSLPSSLKQLAANVAKISESFDETGEFRAHTAPLGFAQIRETAQGASASLLALAARYEDRQPPFVATSLKESASALAEVAEAFDANGEYRYQNAPLGLAQVRKIAADIGRDLEHLAEATAEVVGQSPAMDASPIKLEASEAADFDAFVAREGWHEINDVPTMESFLVQARDRFLVLDKLSDDDLTGIKQQAWAKLDWQFVGERSDLRMFFSETPGFYDLPQVEQARLLKLADSLVNSGRPSAQPATAAPEPAQGPERAYLVVPFKQKDEAKALGARWDRQEQAWFVPPGIDPAPLAKWAPEATTTAPGASEAVAEPKPPAPSKAAVEGRQYLAVPYGERDVAKAAGAAWDKTAKSWYAGPQADISKLQRWLPENVPDQQAPAMRPEEEFAEALRALNCVVDGKHPMMDGKTHRIRLADDKKGEEGGFYVAHLDGHPAGYIKNNRSGLDMRWKSKGYSLDPAESAKLQAEAAAKLQARAAAQLVEHEQTAQRMARQLAQLKPIEQPTPYLVAKEIGVHAGAFTDAAARTTFLPAIDANGKLWSTQYIQEDGTKRFAKNSRKEGCFHVVGGLDALAAAPVLVIGEGYATASTLAEALGHATVAAFDSGNVPAVARALHAKFPSKPVLIAGDDDHHLVATLGVNPGRDKATDAAREVGGKAIFPIFAPGEVAANPKGFTDFNDLATKSVLGRDGLVRQIGAVSDAIRERHAVITQQERPVIDEAPQLPNAVKQQEVAPAKRRPQQTTNSSSRI